MSPSRRCSTGSDPAAGFALLIVLWAMALLALLGSQLVAAARGGNIAVAHNLRIGAEAEAASYGAVQEAIFHLLDRSGRHWSADGTVHQVDIGTVHALVTITDDGSKLNLNLAMAAAAAGIAAGMWCRFLNGDFARRRYRRLANAGQPGACARREGSAICRRRPELRSSGPTVPQRGGVAGRAGDDAATDGCGIDRI